MRGCVRAGKLGDVSPSRSPGRSRWLALAALGLVCLCAWIAWPASGPRGRAAGAVTAPARDAAVRPSTGRAAPLEPSRAPQPAPGTGASRVAEGGEVARTQALPVAPVRKVSGRVSARRDGRAIPDAEIVLSVGRARAQASSGADGWFELAWDDPAEPALEVRAAGFVTARLPRAGGSAVDGEASEAEVLELRLVSEARIEGLVSGPPAVGEGAPSVRLFRRTGRGETSGELARTAVDAGGAFLFTGLAAGDYLVVAEAPGHALGTGTIALAEGERGDLSLALARSGRLSGLVLDRSERPVEGARVMLENERPGLGSAARATGRRETTTGRDGRFVLQGLSAGSNRVEVRAPWGERRTESVVLARSDEDVERTFRVRAPASLEGRVLAADGTPEAEAWVELAWGNAAPGLLAGAERPRVGRWGEGARVRADGAGRFRFDDLPASGGAVLVAVPADARDGRVGLETGLQLVAGTDQVGIELVLARGLRLAGEVLLADGEPLVGADVELVPRLPGRRRSGPLRARTDLAGRFAFESLPPGEYRLGARHPDARAAGESLTLETTREDLRLVLEGSLRIGGEVLDEHDLAVPWAGVRADRVAGPSFVEAGERERRFARADAYGRFQLTELEVGTYELRPYAAGHAARGAPLVVSVPGGAEATLRLEREDAPKPATVSGRVEILGTRAAPSGFEVRGARGALVDYDDGRFRVEGLGPGVHRLELAASGCVPIPTGPLELQAGARVDLGILRFEPGTALRVEVRDPEGRPVGGARVLLRALPAAEGGREGAEPIRLAETQRGRYEVLAPRAAWRLVVESRGLATHGRRLEVRAQESQRLTVTLERQ